MKTLVTHRHNKQTYFWGMIQQAHDGPIVCIVLERQEERAMSVTIEYTRSVWELHQNSIDNGRSTLMFDGNRQGQISVHVCS